MVQKRINICLVSTQGGHFEQLSNLGQFYESYDHFWITNENRQTLSQLQNERKYFVDMGHYKRPWTYLNQVPHFIKIFAKEKPTHIVSTGSGRTALVPFILGRALKIPFIYIDTFSRVYGYSKFGSFLLSLRQQVLCQWPDDKNSRAVYIGPVFKNPEALPKNSNSNHVFVTVGTRDEPFTRLIAAVEELVRKGAIKEKVIVQAGHSKYLSDQIEIFDFCTPDEIDDFIRNAKYVITQESAGTGTKCLKYKTKFLVMPRQYKFGELPSRSDMDEDLHLKLQELKYTKVVNNIYELELAIHQIDKLKTGFHFDNQLAIISLTKILEES